MSLSFFSPKRTTLLVSDEALYIYAGNGKGPGLVESVPWESENFEHHVSNIITKDCGRKPVLILNDMVEQHYRKERVTRSGVSILDRASMVKRKLNFVFPNYPVRAALALKEKASRADKKMGSDIYIFAAVPDSMQLQKLTDAVRQSLAPIAGFCLLPIEAAGMVKVLHDRLSRRGQQKKAHWAIFMGQHQNGSLRQVVIKNGELALTRMTPITEKDNDPQSWAGEVHQEFKATMSYLSRFGYQPEDGLHVMAIADPGGASALQRLMDEDSYKFSVLSAPEAAGLLNLPYVGRENSRYADFLHVAWIGQKSKFTLPMRSAKIEQVSRPRRAAVAAFGLLLLTALGLGAFLIHGLGKIVSLNGQIDDIITNIAQLDLSYKSEIERKKELGFDIMLIQSSIAAYDIFEKSKIDPLALYKGVGDALGKDMRVDKLTVKTPTNYININLLPNGQANSGPPVFLATMQMTYPSTADVDRGNEEVKSLAERLKDRLKDHKVTVKKLLKDYEYSEGIVVEAGDIEKREVNQDFVAEISIEGPPKQ